MVDFDEAAIEAEIRAEFGRYEAALAMNDLGALAGFFWEDPRTLRMTTTGGLYGHAAIVAFRRERDVADVARKLERVEVVAWSPDFGVATAEYRRRISGRRGSQSQVWMRRPEGWRIVAAHVSLGA